MANDLSTKIDFLRQAGTHATAHSGGNFLDHLTGTMDILVRWNARPPVCDAGLFHSVYGTESFEKVTITADMRQDVERMIGEEAEQLVWLFSVLERQSLEQNLDRKDDYALDHKETGERIAISERQYLDLIDLLIANALEQLPRVRRKVVERARRLTHFAHLATPQARQALEAFYHDYDHHQSRGWRRWLRWLPVG